MCDTHSLTRIFTHSLLHTLSHTLSLTHSPLHTSLAHTHSHSHTLAHTLSRTNALVHIADSRRILYMCHKSFGILYICDTKASAYSIYVSQKIRQILYMCHQGFGIFYICVTKAWAYRFNKYVNPINMSIIIDSVHVSPTQKT